MSRNLGQNGNCIYRRRRSVENRLPALTILLLLSVTLPIQLSQAQSAHPAEYQVKAVYLYNFAKFVDWPAATPGTSFNICVLGEDPFGPVLDETLSGETVGGKPAVAKRISNVQDASDCSVLYISSSQQRRLPQIFSALQGMKNILTVSDIDNFAALGGMIEFVSERDRIRFQVNLAAAMKAGLMLSSELLKVATKVLQSA